MAVSSSIQTRSKPGLRALRETALAILSVNCQTEVQHLVTSKLVKSGVVVLSYSKEHARCELGLDCKSPSLLLCVR